MGVGRISEEQFKRTIMVTPHHIKMLALHYQVRFLNRLNDAILRALAKPTTCKGKVETMFRNIMSGFVVSILLGTTAVMAAPILHVQFCGLQARRR
jgi:hypothetical protein